MNILTIDIPNATVIDSSGAPARFRIQVPTNYGPVRAWVGAKPNERAGAPCKAWHESDDDFADLTEVDAHAEARALLRAVAFGLYQQALQLSQT
jgi:hypothetical protein